MAIRGGDIISYLELDTGKYTASMQAAQAQAKQFSQQGATAGDKLQATMGLMANTGRLLTGAVTMPIVGAGAASAKFAIEFESAFAGVRKTVDATEAEYARLNQSILQMGREIPKSHAELAAYMEAGGQLGVPKAQLEKFTKTIADLDVATNLAGESGASMLAQYANVTGMDLSNIDRLGSVIVDLGNNTASTEMDITQMAQRLAGAASILKLTDAQTMGLAATMASLGINAEAGGTAMSRIMQKMLQDVRKGEDGLEAYAKVAGTSADAFAKAFGQDPLSALTMFIDGLNRMNAAGEDIYGTLSELDLSDVRITDTILRMAGAQGQLEANINRANKAWDDNNALTKEASQRYNTTEGRIKRAQNSIREAGITIGNSFLPAIGDAAQGVAELANKFAELDEGTKGNILTGAGVAAAAGPGLLLIKGLIGLLSGPGGLIAAAALGVAGLAALKVAADQASFQEMKDEFGDVELSANEIKDIIAQGFGAPMIDVGPLNAARDAADGAYNKFVDLQTQLEKDVYLVKMGVKTLTPEEIDAQVGGLVSSAQEFFNKEENAAKMTVTAFFGEGSEDGQGMISDIEGAMSGLKAQMAAKGKALGDALKSAIADGKIDETEQKTIDNLRMELAEITARGTLVESQSKRDVLIAKAQNRGLSAESIKQSNEELQNYRDALLDSYEKEYETMLELTANLKNMGGMSEEEYDRRIKAINARYGNIQADADMATLDTAWNMYGRQMVDKYGTSANEAKDILSMPGFDLYGNDKENKENRDKVWAAQNDAKQFLKDMGWMYESLSGMKGVMGDNMPAQYQAMLDIFTQFKTLADLDPMAVAASMPERFKEQGRADAKEKTDTLTSMDNIDTSNVDTAMDAAQKKAEEGMQEVVDTTQDMGEEAGRVGIEAANKGAESTPNTVPQTMAKDLEGVEETYASVGGGGGAAAVEGANAAAASTPNTVEATMVQGVGGLPSAYGAIGGNAVNSLINQVSAGAGRAYAAGQNIGRNLEKGAKDSLGIASPSKKMIAVGDDTTRGVVIGVRKGLPEVRRTSEQLGQTMVNGADSYNQGYKDAVSAGRDYRAPIVRPTGFGPGARQNSRMMTDLPETQGTGGKGGKGGGGKAPAQGGDDLSLKAATAQLKKEQEALKQITQKYDAEREKLLKLSGDWRAYYDKTQAERQVESIQSKYQKLMAAEQAGFDRLSEAAKQKRSEAHNKLMQQLEQNQNAEVSRYQENYKLQQRLANDFLSAQAQALQDAFNKKQNAAHEEDYEKTVADLEKRIRQSRSARERRELTEELERMRRDESLRLEQEALNQALKGIEALKDAVSSGVIGLGDLTGDRSLPASAFTGGLNQVQGVSAEALDKALKAIADRQEAQGGNHYTIDLSGAVIRDDSDIDRIVKEFEARNRSIQRDMKR